MVTWTIPYEIVSYIIFTFLNIFVGPAVKDSDTDSSDHVVPEDLQVKQLKKLDMMKETSAWTVHLLDCGSKVRMMNSKEPQLETFHTMMKLAMLMTNFVAVIYII